MGEEERMRFLIVAAVLVAAALLAAPASAGPAPGIAWQHLYGGGDGDYATSIDRTADGGYVVAGYTYSSMSGDVAGVNHGGVDVWLLKLDAAGAIEGKRLYGGGGDDHARCVEQTADGGYIILGHSSSSTSWDVGDANHGGTDIWVVKTDANGTIQKQMLLGGEGYEFGYSVRQTTDLGYIIAGSTESPAVGDPPVLTRGSSDAWVIRLDAAGTVLWQRPLGGSGYDAAYSVRQTADGGFVLAGQSFSTAITEGGTTETNHGSDSTSDAWVVKLSPEGVVQKHLLLGGGGTDEAASIVQTPDLGYVIAGSSSSSESGDVTGVNHGMADIWVAKLGPAGAILSQRLLGGAANEYAAAVEQVADGGFLVAGWSFSDAVTEGGTTETSPGLGGMDPDLWVVRLGPGGATRWHDLLGGSQYDEGFDAVQAGDGGYVLVGNSWSDDGDVAGLNQGTSDLWVLELEPDAPAVLAVPPSMLVPTDTNGDGKYEDVNGNGRPDFADVVLYFNQMSWIAANEPVPAFDYNGNGRIDFADVVWLFNHL